MRLYAFHLLLLAPLPSAMSEADCVRPPPPPSLLPTVADCHRLLQIIAVAARMQHNVPLIWSRHPPGIEGEQLPVFFTYGTSNLCEFVVDVDGGREAEYDEDVFPLGDVVNVGKDIMQTCLAGEAGTESTIGSEIIGPGEVIRVRLRKKLAGGEAGGSLNLLDATLLGLNAGDRATLIKTLEKAENMTEAA